MLFMISSWLLWYFAISGIGKWLGKKLFSDAETLDCFESFWLGLTSLTALAGIFQLFCPLNNVVLGTCLIAGLTCYSLHRPNAVIKVPQLHFLIMPAIIVIVSLPYLSLDETLKFSTDTRGYHISVVRWLNEFATVPGLAHLHTRLAYGTGSSFFTIAALFDNWIWDGRSAWLVNPFLLAVTTLQIFREILYGTDKTKIYSLACIPYLFLEILYSRPGLYFDAAVFYFLIIAGLHVIKMAGEKVPFDSLPEKRPFSFYIVPSLAAMAFTVKPMAVVVLLCCALVYGALFLKRFYLLFTIKARLASILAAAVVPLLLLSGYMARNFVTSGWLFFPSPYGEVSTAWSLSREAVETEYHILKFHARAPGIGFMTLGSRPMREWAPAWLRGNLNVPLNIISFFLPLLLGFVFALWYVIRGKTRIRISYLIALSASFASLIFWFLSAPDVRFANGIAWLLCAFAISALYDSGAFAAVFNFTLRRTAELVIAAIIAETILLSSAVLPRRNFNFSWWHTPKAASGPVNPVVLNNGQTPPLTVWVPEDMGIGCINAPLPCTPYPNDRLCLLVPGDLSKGFYLKPAD